MYDMTKISINTEKCIGCGLCIKDCTRNIIHLTNNKATVENSFCIECGHCVAICPENAVEFLYYDKNELIEYDDKKFKIDPNCMLNFMKFRRTIRRFKSQEVEKDKLNSIIEAGRYSPTGANRQTNRFLVLSDKIKEIKEIALQTLYDIASDKDSDVSKQWAYYREKWINMYNDYKKSGIDKLFYDAPKVLVVVGSDTVNGALASSYMELMTYAQGLGVCYVGFFQVAASINPKIKEMLNIKSNEEIITTMVVGYPEIVYKRTVNRKKAKIDIF